METHAGLKQIESQLSITCDRITALKAKIEDLLFRAQRIAAAQKNNMANNDTMFIYDLRHFRRDARAFSMEISTLPTVLGGIERGATPDPTALKLATSVQRLAMRLTQALRSLHDTTVLAHQHIRAADHKVEAWAVSQEVEQLVMQGQGLPTTANKIVIAVSAVKGGAPGA